MGNWGASGACERGGWGGTWGLIGLVGSPPPPPRAIFSPPSRWTTLHPASRPPPVPPAPPPTPSYFHWLPALAGKPASGAACRIWGFGGFRVGAGWPLGWVVCLGMWGGVVGGGLKIAQCHGWIGKGEHWGWRQQLDFPSSGCAPDMYRSSVTIPYLHLVHLWDTDKIDPVSYFLTNLTSLELLYSLHLDWPN